MFDGECLMFDGECLMSDTKSLLILYNPNIFFCLITESSFFDKYVFSSDLV